MATKYDHSRVASPDEPLQDDGLRFATLVTGSSSGIGAELAVRFASTGRRMVLVALPQEADALETVARRCREAGALECLALGVDLSASGAVDTIAQKVEAANLSVDQLVNNAGVGEMANFAVSDEQRISLTIDVNCKALSLLTRRFLPKMIERNEGLILNMASTGALVPGPGMSTYFASKAFVLSLTEAISFEVRDSGIHVMTVMPGPTRTAFVNKSGMQSSRMFDSMRSMTAIEVADETFRAIAAKRARVVTGWSNKVAAFGLKILPRRKRLQTIHDLHQAG